MSYLQYMCNKLYCSSFSVLNKYIYIDIKWSINSVLSDTFYPFRVTFILAKCYCYCRKQIKYTMIPLYDTDHCLTFFPPRKVMTILEVYFVYLNGTALTSEDVGRILNSQAVYEEYGVILQQLGLTGIVRNRNMAFFPSYVHVDYKLQYCLELYLFRN